MDTDNQNSIFIQEISDIYTVDSSLLGDKPALGFTITYSNGVFENVLECKDDYDAALGLISKARNELVSLLQSKVRI